DTDAVGSLTVWNVGAGYQSDRTIVALGPGFVSTAADAPASAPAASADPAAAIRPAAAASAADPIRSLTTRPASAADPNRGPAASADSAASWARHRRRRLRRHALGHHTSGLRPTVRSGDVAHVMERGYSCP